jgi:hypothetical protein
MGSFWTFILDALGLDMRFGGHKTFSPGCPPGGLAALRSLCGTLPLGPVLRGCVVRVTVSRVGCVLVGASRISASSHSTCDPVLVCDDMGYSALSQWQGWDSGLRCKDV